MTKYFVLFRFSYVLVGIISWGLSCGQKNVPGIYASVSNALNFIAWDTKCKYEDDYKGNLLRGIYTKTVRR